MPQSGITGSKAKFIIRCVSLNFPSICAYFAVQLSFIKIINAYYKYQILSYLISFTKYFLNSSYWEVWGIGFLVFI